MTNLLRHELICLALLKEKWDLLSLWEEIGDKYEFNAIYQELLKLVKEGAFERKRRNKSKYYFKIRLTFQDWLIVKKGENNEK